MLSLSLNASASDQKNISRDSQKAVIPDSWRNSRGGEVLLNVVQEHATLNMQGNGEGSLQLDGAYEADALPILQGS